MAQNEELCKQVDTLRQQLQEANERASAATHDQAELRRLRAEYEAMSSDLSASSSADIASRNFRQARPSMPPAHTPPAQQPPPPQQQQPEKVIIMTSSSMRTLETEKAQFSEQGVRPSPATPALVAAPGATIHSPRPVHHAAVPVRQCSAGAAPMMRQQVPVSCSSVPVFRQVSSDTSNFSVGKDGSTGGGPPPPAGQVFRRYSGNGGVTSPRPAGAVTGGPSTPGQSPAVSSASSTSGISASALSVGGRLGVTTGLRAGTDGQPPPQASAQSPQAVQGVPTSIVDPRGVGLTSNGGAASGPLLAAPPAPAPVGSQGRVTPQRLIPPHAVNEVVLTRVGAPRWPAAA